ncbi:hypothetical protein [Nocardia jiangxiensis]|uniref:Uncharacterized protein n=1 Tax=Nocardia jiangxiensis TaxID=282685 RepID=A0ABW6RVL0_9NOCA|nr:hypothetical protein [Nocardia jiangxiensis]
MTTADLARLTAPGQIGFALVTPSDDDRVRWIQQHCKALPPDRQARFGAGVWLRTGPACEAARHTSVTGGGNACATGYFVGAQSSR